MSDGEPVADISYQPEPPAVTWPRRGFSHYGMIDDPQCDPWAFARLIQELGGNFTRAWLCYAWGIRGPGETGTYDGHCPVVQTGDGRWDLFAWSDAYFDRLRECTEAMNAHGVIPQYTLLELYTWSERKDTLLWVPDQHRGPWRNNVNGVKWGHPDDPTFFSLPDQWQRSFIAKVVETLTGLSWVAEMGNEMPESAMQTRQAEHFRACGFKGDITINRQGPRPGEYVNHDVGGGLIDRIAFHGQGDISYLDEVHKDEPVYKTFRQFYDSDVCEAARVIWSGDGVGSNSTDPENIYDEPTILRVADDAKRRGVSIEWQARELKLGRFHNGRFDLDDLQRDFTRALLA